MVRQKNQLFPFSDLFATSKRISSAKVPSEQTPTPYALGTVQGRQSTCLLPFERFPIASCARRGSIVLGRHETITLRSMVLVKFEETFTFLILMSRMQHARRT